MPIRADQTLRTDSEIILDAVMILSEKFWETHDENELFPIPVLTVEEAMEIISNNSKED